MVEVIDSISSSILEAYNTIISALPSGVQDILNIFILSLLVVAYAYMVWKGYKFISKKNPLGLNLSKYNRNEHPFSTRLLAGILYFVEYILILPFIIFGVFVVFTFFLITLAQNYDISLILIISAVVIVAIRMTAYISQELSQEISKMLPMTLLAVAVLNPNTFTQGQYIEKITTAITQIPTFFGEIMYYLLFIIAVEMILRFFDFIFSLFGLEKDDNVAVVPPLEKEVA